MASFSLSTLEGIIADRSVASATESYTKSLLEAGIGRAAKKFGEESVEAIIAAISSDEGAFISESADVLYHLLVLLRIRGIPLSSVIAELERRTVMSGHAEKAARTK